VLDHLPDSHRDIIELRLAGLTTNEVADALGLTQSAVKSAQSRAYKRLRELLAPPEGATP
jgi:RNA polymerase sigma factor (sigma-70 family)